MNMRIAACRVAIRRAVFVAAFCALPCTASGSAWADSVWFIDATAPVGGCLGERDTPLCAAATWVACLGVDAAGACEAADLLRNERRPLAANSILMLVEGVRTIGADVRRNTPELTFAAEGNVEVVFRAQTCPPAQSCRLEETSPSHLFLRPDGSRWQVVGWVPAVGDVACEHYHADRPQDPQCKILVPESDYRWFVTLAGEIER